MLVIHNPGGVPLGQFDGYGSETLTFKGGEVCTYAGQAWPTTGAADVNNDGYVTNATGKMVPGITKTWTGSPLGTVTVGPYFLADDGTTGYGTLFGAVVGGSVGTQVNSPTVFTGAVLGPHTATGSGKVTVWDKPGLYGVTLDAVDTASTGLVPTNTSIAVGTKLGFTSAGLLTVKGSSNDATSGTASLVVGHVASFETNGSLVTTPQNLVAALNSPSGDVSSVQALKFYQLVFWYAGAGATTF